MKIKLKRVNDEETERNENTKKGKIKDMLENKNEIARWRKCKK